MKNPFVLEKSGEGEYVRQGTMIARDLAMHFNKSGAIEFQVQDFRGSRAGKDAPGPFAPGAVSMSFYPTLKMISDPFNSCARLRKYFDLLYALIRTPNDANYQNFVKWAQIVVASHNAIKTAQATTTVSIGQIRTFCKEFDLVGKEFDSSIEPLLLEKVSEDYDIIPLINQTAIMINEITMVLNFITNRMENAALLGDSYCGTIRNLEELDRFVRESIKEGIPPKYIAYNVAVLTNTGDADHPMMGQSRVVFFGTGDSVFKNKSSVYKIAMNQMGYRANKTEKRVSDDFKNMGISQYIASIQSLEKEGCVLQMERSKDVGKGTGMDANDLRTKINEELSNRGRPYNFEDIHTGNIGRPILGGKNEWIAIDYGWVSKI